MHTAFLYCINMNMCCLITPTTCAFFHCVGCSSMEQKVDRLSEMTAQELQKREDSAQQIKRCLLGDQEVLVVSKGRT